MQSEKGLDVAIIGGGWSGILACKWMIQNGLNVLAFEGSDDIGGVFKYREDVKDAGGVMKSTHTTSSKTTTEMSDYPMPHHFPAFPSHEQILQYLNDYVDHFKIRPHFKMKTKIVSAKKVNDHWVLEDSKGHHYKSKYLVVCSGVHQFPDYFFLKDEKFKDATVPMRHACTYKRLTKEFEDKKILIYGGGETSSDISAELCHVAKRVFLSIPHGQWFANRYQKVSDHMDHPFLLDAWSSELRVLVDPVDKGYAAQYYIEKDSGVCGHGIEQWESAAPYLGQFLNKSSHIDHYLVLGSLAAKGEVTRVTGNEVAFADGSRENIDMIIFCCGYKTVFPFLKDEKYVAPINERFKYIFDNDDPTVAFMGFARPVVGSIPAISEMQAIYVSKIFSGKLHLPNKKVRDKIIRADLARQSRQFAKTSHRIKGLVNFGQYVEELCVLSNVSPNYIKLFFKSPKKWFAAVIAP